MTPMLCKIIPHSQSGFLPGRNIMDGIAIAIEVIHSAKKQKDRAYMLKLDFEKAYDTMD